jgi:hypothetical protein
MATVSDTINGALRKIGVLAAGRSPRPADQADTLATLRGMYRQWINNGTFGRLRDVVPLTDYIALPNERVYRDVGAVTSVTLPELVSGWWQVWDCNRWGWDEGIYPTEVTPQQRRTDATTPRDASVVVVNDAVTRKTVDFIYDGHTKEWRSIYDLGLSDEAPFSFRDPKGLESVLALQIVDEFAGQVGQMTTAMATQFMASLASRQSFHRAEVGGEYF